MIRPFFTVPDPSLSQDSSVDPMGIQVIWTGLGQHIFQSRITTIANDLRIFTFNLFHHDVINQLLILFPDIKGPKRYRGWRTETDIKTGLLMFLEDLVTHVFYNALNSSEEDSAAIESLGILGMTKVRREYATNEANLTLVASKRAGILKNQLNLGMTGRYKGPMMNMGYFTRSFEYLPEFEKDTRRLFNDWKDIKELRKLLLELLMEVINNSDNKNFPAIRWMDLKRHKRWKHISELYISCFGQRKLDTAPGEFWKDKLGLNSGAARALYDIVGNHIHENEIRHAVYFQEASNYRGLEATDKEHLERIIRIEPFLSHSEYLLRYLSQHQHKKLTDIADDLALLRQNIQAAAPTEIPELGMATRRLTELKSAMLAGGTPFDWVKSVLTYHERIMKLRGGHSWVDIMEDQTFRHHFGPSLPVHVSTVEKYLKSNIWYHTYYLETLRNIYKGLNGWTN